MRFRSKAFEKISCEPRFADARFAGNQHDLTLAALRPRPAPQQQLGFFLAPDERSQTARMQCLEAAFDGARPQRHPDVHGPGNALKVSGAKVIELEEIAEKAARSFGNDHGVRLGNPLQTRCEPWRLADDVALLRIAQSNQIADNDQPGCNANTGLQRSRWLERPYRSNHLQPGANCSLGVILMGLRVAKVHKHAI